MLPHSSHFIVASCIAFLFGIGIAWSWSLPLVASIAIGVFGLCVAITHPREIALLGCIIASFALGSVRVATIPQNSVQDGAQLDADVVITREPQLYPNQQRLVVRVHDDVHVQLDVPLQPRFTIGDKVHLSCALSLPTVTTDFVYDKYLARYDIYALCDKHPHVEFVSAGSSLQTAVIAFKHRAVQAVQHVLPMPEQAIVLGMVFGVDHQLPQEIVDAFRATGTTHLLVISGSQIVLIVGVCSRLLQRTPLRRRTSMLLIVALLLAYLIMTGWQASVLRAALCACCVFGVELLGRTGSALRLLLYVATIMVAINPYVLLYDAGFQLSFLATAGIIAFASRFEHKLQWIPETAGVRTAAATSLAAMIPTTPLIAYSFHTFSPVSLFANMCAVPMSGILTISGFGFALLASVSTQVAYLFAPALYLLSHIFLHVVLWFSHLPYASINLPT